MSEAKESPATETDGEGDAPKKGKKKLLLIVVGLVVILAIVGGLFASGMLGGKKKTDDHAVEETADAEAEGHGDAGHGEAAEEESGHGSDDGHGKKGGHDAVDVKKPVFYELPQFLVNLNSTSNQVSFIKISVTLELKDQKSLAIVEANKPRVVDTFNTYLRELRAPDLQGSAGIYRLRDELLTRMNTIMEGGPVKDILFTEIIIQ